MVVRDRYKVQWNDTLSKWYLYVWRPRFSMWSGIKAFDTREEAEAEKLRYEQDNE